MRFCFQNNWLATISCQTVDAEHASSTMTQQLSRRWNRMNNSVHARRQVFILYLFVLYIQMQRESKHSKNVERRQNRISANRLKQRGYNIITKAECKPLKAHKFSPQPKMSVWEVNSSTILIFQFSQLCKVVPEIMMCHGMLIQAMQATASKQLNPTQHSQHKHQAQRSMPPAYIPLGGWLIGEEIARRCSQIIELGNRIDSFTLK